MTADTPPVRPFQVDSDGITLTGQQFTPNVVKAHTVLLPGAGGTFTQDGLTALARLCAASGCDTLVVNLAHNARGGPPRPPEKNVAVVDRLINTFAPHAKRVIVGGKSYGSRVALLYAAANSHVSGVIAYGFPLHAPGKTATRDSMFKDVTVPGLFLQGTRDPFGPADTLATALKAYGGNARLVAVEGADHDLAVGKKYAPDGQKRTPTDTFDAVAVRVSDWLGTVIGLS